ncbi:MAG: putative Mg2+ transporter-C (MgtC) family protein [Comamonadaceae bacterium]|nr:MAG: putative Mg2+ transporter-C (MgtC) family protein [Comamonadaceae bacterium]
MGIITQSYLASFWSIPMMEVNLLVFMNLLGALMLGLLVGYERSYHGRAAGMRTYGIVCMASAALTVFAGYPGFWWGGAAQNAIPVDPTRVIQGIVTGVGFLGAGVIMKEGLNISGLTTAASIWASSAIGVLVGIGFFGAAILLTLLSASLMMWGPKLEAKLPSRRAMGVVLQFSPEFEPDEKVLKNTVAQWGYMVAEGSLNISSTGKVISWHFVMVALKSHPNPGSLFELSRHLREIEGVGGLQISHARN